MAQEEIGMVSPDLIKNDIGQTPFDIAVRQKNKEIVVLLKKHGAKE